MLTVNVQTLIVYVTLFFIIVSTIAYSVLLISVERQTNEISIKTAASIPISFFVSSSRGKSAITNNIDLTDSRTLKSYVTSSARSQPMRFLHAIIAPPNFLCSTCSLSSSRDRSVECEFRRIERRERSTPLCLTPNRASAVINSVNRRDRKVSFSRAGCYLAKRISLNKLFLNKNKDIDSISKIKLQLCL